MSAQYMTRDERRSVLKPGDSKYWNLTLWRLISGNEYIKQKNNICCIKPYVVLELISFHENFITT